MKSLISALTIPAKIYSCDFAKYAEFDAVAWFSTAPPESILNLAHHDWGGEYAADEVARCSKIGSAAVADVLACAMYLRHGGLACRVQCTVDSVAALEWLAYHRPEVLAALRRAA
jgi:hypothetical protein